MKKLSFVLGLMLSIGMASAQGADGKKTKYPVCLKTESPTVKQETIVKKEGEQKLVKKYPTKRFVAVKPSADVNKKLEPLKVQPAKKVVRNSRELKLENKEK